MTRLTLRLLVVGGLLCGLAPIATGQGITYFPPASGGTVTSPVATDPISFTGAGTCDNAANTPWIFADGLQDSTLTAGRVTFAGAAGRLSDDADLTFATDTLTATKAIGSTSVCAAGAVDAANSVCVSSNAVTGEGATADGNEGVLAFGNASADNTLTLLATASGVELSPTTGALLTAAGTGTGRVSVGGVLCKGAAATATTGTSEEILATCTIPANTLTAAGSRLEIAYYGHTAANGNSKTLTVRIGGIGGTIVGGVQSTAANNNAVRSLSPIEVSYASSTTATVVAWGAFCSLAASPASPSCTQGVVHATAAAITWTNANDLVITGTTPTFGDLTLDSYLVRVVQ